MVRVGMRRRFTARWRRWVGGLGADEDEDAAPVRRRRARCRSSSSSSESGSLGVVRCGAVSLARRRAATASCIMVATSDGVLLNATFLVRMDAVPLDAGQASSAAARRVWLRWSSPSTTMTSDANASPWCTGLDAAADVVRPSAACAAASRRMQAAASARLRFAWSWALSICPGRRTLPCASSMRTTCVTLCRAVSLLGNQSCLSRMDGVAPTSTIATVNVSSIIQSNKVDVWDLGRAPVWRPFT